MLKSLVGCNWESVSIFNANPNYVLANISGLTNVKNINRYSVKYAEYGNTLIGIFFSISSPQERGARNDLLWIKSF